jgi:manganese/zinc/iron transport system permease protein
MATPFEWSSTLQNVLLGASVLGVAGGAMGSFTFLRRQSLLGDALAHAALPGVCLAFLVSGTKSTPALFAGALCAGVAGALLVLAIIRGSKVKEDAAIGIVLSVFFGAGIVLLTVIQHHAGGGQSGLETYLFGQAATMLAEDVVVMAVVAGVVLALLALLHKELKLLSFDREFGASLGFPVRGLEVILTSLLVVVVVIGLQTVGVVLMVATLVTPAAAARQWTQRLGSMIFLSAAIGGLSGAGGAVLSAATERLPTGPTIVVISSLILIASLLFAPARGMLWGALRARRLRGRVRGENLLKDIYQLGERGGDRLAPVSGQALREVRGRSRLDLARSARSLLAARLVDPHGDGWRLSAAGLEAAERIVRKHRLWEVYLTRRLALPGDHVHRDAEAMEHALSDRAVEELDQALGYPETDPHGQPIPRPGRVAGAGAGGDEEEETKEGRKR